MGELRLPGLLTGIDTGKLVSQLMMVERRTLNLYLERQKVWNERKDALGGLQSKVDVLRSTVADLSNARELRAYTTASSDTDIVTAEASHNAFEGNHTVTVNQLANAERWVHTAGKEYAEDFVGAGTFIYSYNHQETILTTTAETTLEDLMGLINNDPDNAGVTANLLRYNGAYHLMLNGNEAGSDYEISINAGNTEVWQAASSFTVGSENAALADKIVALDQFSGTFATGESGTITISGQQHDGTVVSAAFSVNANTKLGHLIQEINDAFGGTATATLENGQIRLTDHTSGVSQMQLSLAYDPGSTSTGLELPAISQATQGGTVMASLAGFTTADFIETQSAQDAQIRVDGYPLSGTPVPEVQTLTHQQANAGTYTLTYDGQTTASISYNASVAEVQAALEALSNVNAGDITVGGDSLDVNGVMTFTFSSTLGDVALLSIDPSNLDPSAAGDYVMAEQTKGDDGSGDWITRSSNTIDDVIHGVTLHLHDTGTVQVNLTRDIESVKEKLGLMVTAYNEAVAFLKEKTGYNDVLQTAGVLRGDSVVSNIAHSLRLPLIQQTSGFVIDVDSFLMPGQIGFELDRYGMLSLKTSAFDEAIAQDYRGVLALIGADKTGSSDSNTVEFYSASSNGTTAGTYDVEVTISGGTITGARIKRDDELTWRDATVAGNIVAGDSAFDEHGRPVYPENGLQLSVDLGQDGTFAATVRIKQGFAGAMEDILDRILNATTGTLPLDRENVNDQIEHLQEQIDREENRLTKREQYLTAKFARLEKTLAFLQNQMAALGMSG